MCTFINGTYAFDMFTHTVQLVCVEGSHNFELVRIISLSQALPLQKEYHSTIETLSLKPW